MTLIEQKNQIFEWMKENKYQFGISDLMIRYIIIGRNSSVVSISDWSVQNSNKQDKNKYVSSSQKAIIIQQ